MADKKRITKAEMEAAFNEANTQNTLCSLAAMLEGMDPDLREVVQTKVHDVAHYSGRVIAKVLKSLDLTGPSGSISAETINRHRKGDCRCPK